MTANSGSPSEPPKGFQGFKLTLAQGIIGAVSLAGTTAIPLMVNRYLAPPTPAESPAPAAQVSPAPTTAPAAAPAAIQPVAAPAVAPTVSPAVIQPVAAPASPIPTTASQVVPAPGAVIPGTLLPPGTELQSGTITQVQIQPMTNGEETEGKRSRKKREKDDD